MGEEGSADASSMLYQANPVVAIQPDPSCGSCPTPRTEAKGPVRPRQTLS